MQSGFLHLRILPRDIFDDPLYFGSRDIAQEPGATARSENVLPIKLVGMHRARRVALLNRGIPYLQNKTLQSETSLRSVTAAVDSIHEALLLQLDRLRRPLHPAMLCCDGSEFL